jgi:cobalt/nickel transport system permease protein
MHIPDGFLDARTAVASGVLAAAGVGLALRVVRRTVPPRRVPLIGLAAAFVFAAQMLNFPVAGGTSGHLLGAVLAAVLLGPSAAVLVMTSVLLLQAFMFADGGVTALGANILNMAVLAPLVVYAAYRAVFRLAGGGLRARLAGTAFGAWCSTVAASVLCAGELAASGMVPWRAAFPAMAAIHMLIGVGEALITTLVVAAVARVRPELLDDPEASGPRAGYRELIGYGLLASFGLALFVAPFASDLPDGLERAAAMLGFEGRAAEEPTVASPLPGYAVPGWESAVTSTAIAGCVGTLLAFVLAFVLALALAPRPAAGGRGPAGRGAGGA